VKVYFQWSQLVEQLAAVRKNRRVVFTNGCFDILHLGHVRYLQQAKDLGDFLVVGLNTDESVKRLKGATRPVQGLESRSEVMAALSSVDFVTSFSKDTPLELIKVVRPDVLVKGGDYKPEQIVGSDFVLSYGGQVQSLQFVPGYSTSSILARV